MPAKTIKNDKDMEARTINVSVNVPRSYGIGRLQQQLTAYAQQLVTRSKSAKRGYRHEALCGIFNSNSTADELIEDYLKEKYNL